MAKYSDEFKLKVVKEYLEGSLGYRLLAKNMVFRITSQSLNVGYVLIKNLVKMVYVRKHTKQVYSVQFKLDVLQLYETNRCFLSRYSD